MFGVEMSVAAHAAEIAVAEVIGEDEDDVWRSGVDWCATKRQHQCDEETDSSDHAARLAGGLRFGNRAG
jgi:hypothetical protein